MKSWGIRKQVMVLALLPALAVGVILSVYFTYTQIRYITESLNAYGRSTVSQIAPTAEYALFSGNIQTLRHTLSGTLRLDDQIARITIYNADNAALLTITGKAPAATRMGLLHTLLNDRQLLTFRAPITTVSLPLSDFDDNLLLKLQNGNVESSTIGFAELTLSTHRSTEQKTAALLQGSLLTLVILLVSGLLAMRISKQIAQPVQLMTRAVRKIAAGDYNTRIRQDAPGELAILEECVNTMAEELRVAQFDMESRINEFTLELQETLEELEIRNVELDITRSNAMQASKAKSEFLANMSHEIRTPLSGIIGFTELLENTELDPQQRDYARTIQKSAESLMTIIDDILDLSKIESGKLEISHMRINILDIIEDVIDLLAPAAYERNIELIYRIEPDVARWIESDPVRIRQVLLNLVGNAVKFTVEGYVYLLVEHDAERETGGIKFTVSDTGIGMSPESKKKLFTAFTQADTSITRRFGGTGLGLVISRKLVLLMDGAIGFDSTEGEGSTFWFTIPVRAQEDAVEPLQQSLENARIALIEEQRLCRDALESMLQQWGCEVRELSLEQAREELSAAHATGFDAVVVGISRKHLPFIDEYAGLVADLNRRGLPTLIVPSTRTHTEVGVMVESTVCAVAFRTTRQTAIRDMLAGLLEQSGPAGVLSARPRQDRPSKREHPLSVLVVDDNEINLRLAEILLSKQGLDVSTARSGDESIDRFRQASFDLVFMDLHMPGLDGYETARRIRLFSDSGRKSPVIIALTANAMKQELDRVSEFGMDDVVIKPISENMIQDILRKWFPEAADNPPPAHRPGIPVGQDAPRDDVFSPDTAVRRANGNSRLAIELFNMLRSELPRHRQAIVDNLASADWKDLREHAHKLNGASRCCGTPALQAAANTLEEALDNNMLNRIEELAGRLLEEIDDLIRYELDTPPLQPPADSSTTTATE